MATLTERLSRHPKLQRRVEHILDLMESTNSDLKRADEAEREITELLRQLGHETLSGWADQRVEQEAAAGKVTQNWRSAGEKNSTGTAATASLK